MDFKQMASEIGVDTEDFIELADMLVDVSTNDLTDFEQAIHSGDLEKAAMAAHSIKGAAGNLGFTKVASSAAVLEEAAKAQDTSNFEEHIDCIKTEIDLIKNALGNA